MKSLLKLGAAFGTAVILGSCTERLESSGVCAILCPSIGGEIQNVTIDAIAFDTTVQTFSGPGAEPALLLATRGDTLDARVIVRFDSLPATFVEGADPAKPVTQVDSASLRLKLDTALIKGTDPVALEVYDVDTTANDTSSVAVLAMFRPDRFLASRTFARADLKDSIEVVLPSEHVLAKIQAGQRLRLGLRAVSTGSSQIVFLSTAGANPPKLRYRVSADTLIAAVVQSPRSLTPTDDAIVAANLADYTVYARRPPQGSPADLEVGGIPARRSYFRFAIPSSIIDSSIVVRATLILNQIPNPLLDPTDTVYVLSHLVVAGEPVTDPAKAAQIFAGNPVDTLRTRPGDSGEKLIELALAFSAWRTIGPSEGPRAIVLRARDEGISPLEITFSSIEAAPELRPRLRISYTTNVPLGVP